MRLFDSKRKKRQLGCAQVARGEGTNLRTGQWTAGNPKN